MQVGQKVVCIDASKQPHVQEELSQDVPNWVEKGKIYTVRSIEDFDYVVGIRLEEIVNPIKYFRLLGRSMESTFRSDRFRELQDVEVESEVEIKEAVI